MDARPVSRSTRHVDHLTEIAVVIAGEVHFASASQDEPQLPPVPRPRLRQVVLLVVAGRPRREIAPQVLEHRATGHPLREPPEEPDQPHESVEAHQARIRERIRRTPDDAVADGHAPPPEWAGISCCPRWIHWIRWTSMVEIMGSSTRGTKWMSRTPSSTSVSKDSRWAVAKPNRSGSKSLRISFPSSRTSKRRFPSVRKYPSAKPSVTRYFPGGRG